MKGVEEEDTFIDEGEAKKGADSLFITSRDANLTSNRAITTIASIFWTVSKEETQQIKH